jgi:uncharacterized membrane protein YgcG
MMSLRKLQLLGCVCSLLPAMALAQTAAPAAAPKAPASAQAAPAATVTRVHGTITDPDGELIPGATVTLTPTKGASGQSIKSGSDGTYNLNLAPGTYTFVVTMPGFASYSALNVKIPAVASTTLDAKMQIGSETQVVNVDANSVQLSVDPDNNASSTVLSGKDLEALSDDPDELSSELTALAGPSAGPNGGQIYVDGFTGGQLPPKSSIREIRINQNPFSAQYDRLGYGRVEIFTKPGTDKLHGNIQINGNPSQLNDGNPLSTTYEPPYHTLFMFGNLTGPVNKNASYNLGGSYRQIQDDNFTDAYILSLPGTTTLCAPGNATCVQTQYLQSTYFPQTRADIAPRLDLALGAKNVLTTRYQYVNNTSTNALPGNGSIALPTTAYNTNSLSNILQMSDTQTYSTRLINETRFEYEREHVATTAANNTPSVSVSGIFTSGGYSAQNVSDHQDHYEVQNYTSLQLKKNFIRFGGRLRVTREAEDTTSNTNGSFTYSSLSNYASGAVRQFSLTQVNNHKIGDTYDDLGMYAESDWKAKPNLTISYGVRYETQNHLPDHHDFAPRVSLNYGLFASKGAPKTVLRGGFGMFYDRFAQGSILTLQAENGVNETVFTVQNPGTGCTPSVATQGSAALIAACGATPSTQTTYAAANNLRTPYITQFALGGDQQIGRNATLSVNYIHSQGAHQLASQNLNYSVAAQAPATTTVGPQYQYFSEGVFNQNQLVLNGRVQTSKRVSIFGYYSLSSAHGDTSGNGAAITTPGNIAADYGRTTYDVRQRVFLSGSISLPSFIQVSPFMIAQSGNPYNINTGSDNNGDSFFNDRPYSVPNGYVPAVTPPAGVVAVNSIAGCGTFANPGYQPSGAKVAPINSCTGPALFTLNVRVTKTFGFGPERNPTPRGGGQGGQGGPGGGGPPGGGRSGGGGGRGGGGGFGGGSSTSTGKRYNFALGAQFQNLFANSDYATPIGTLTSPNFGKSTQLSGGPYTTNAALRRISVQASFTF